MIDDLICRIPGPIRDSVMALATAVAEVAVAQTKRNLIELCQAHPELTAEQISLIVARSLHSGPLAIADSPPVSRVNPSLFTSGSEVA